MAQTETWLDNDLADAIKKYRAIILSTRREWMAGGGLWALGWFAGLCKQLSWNLAI